MVEERGSRGADIGAKEGWGMARSLHGGGRSMAPNTNLPGVLIIITISVNWVAVKELNLKYHSMET